MSPTKRKKPRKLNLTKRTVDALRPPTSQDREWFYDVAQPALALCVLASGGKAFYRAGRDHHGQPQRKKLGPWPDMTVDQARRMVREANGEIVKGIDPFAKREQLRREATLQDLFDRWLADAQTRKRTWKSDVWQFNKYLGRLRRRHLSTITTPDVEALHAQLGKDHGHFTANRVRALLCAMFGAARKVGFTGPNPCVGVARFPEVSRERFLRPNEMRPFFAALKAEPDPWCDFWLICLFSGARRGNIAAMKWAALDLQHALWHLGADETKNKRPTVVVLPPPAVAILEQRFETRVSDQWVFPSATGGSHIVDPRKSWLRVVKASGLENLRPHDLRRSLGSWQAIAGASLPIIGASLGHTDTRATAVYSRLLTAPVAQSVTSAVAAMIEAGETDQKKSKKGGRSHGKTKPR